MGDSETNKKVTLDVELKDLLEIVSKVQAPSPISSPMINHQGFEEESLRKAWYEHMLLSLEKLNDMIENVRRIDIVNLRNELKEEIRRIDEKTEKAEDELKTYKKDIIDPIKTKVTALAIKIGIYSVIAGSIGSGLMGIVIYILKEYVIKPKLVGGP